MASIVLSSVDAFTRVLKDLLRKASDVKSEGTITQSLDKQTFGDQIDHIGKISGKRHFSTLESQYAAIETTSRNILFDLIVRESLPMFNSKLIEVGHDIDH